MNYDEMSEKTCLAAMLRYPEDLISGVDILILEDFFYGSHRVIFSAIKTISRTEGTADVAALIGMLKDAGRLGDAGGTGYIFSLDETLPMKGATRRMAKRLRELSNRRAVIKVAQDILDSSEEGEKSEVLINHLETGIAAIRSADSTDMVSASIAVDRVMASLDVEKAEKPLATGIFSLDTKTQGGIRLGELWTIGALPSRGKSSLGRQIAAHNASRGIPTLVFSIEMTVEQWFGLDTANAAKVPAWRIREPQYMNFAIRQAMQEASEKMRDWKLWFDESSSIHINRLIAKARLAVLQHGIKLIVVDYTQRVTGDGRELRHRVGDVAEKLAQFAKKHQVAVIQLSQLARRGDINVRPTMQDLKEAGELEAHSHAVLLPYRPIDRQTEDFTGQDEIIVAKQRFGPIGAIHVTFDNDTLTFKEKG